MKRRGERGVVIVVLAVFLPVLLAGLGLVIDNGEAMDLKRQLQSAADAGAVAAAHAIRTGQRPNVQTFAVDSVKRNGFSSPSTKVDVYNPPITGKRAGDNNYVEVVLQKEAPLFFMKAFYAKPLLVTARAISGVKPWSYCMLILDPSMNDALQVQGNSIVDARCNVQVNSSSSTAATTGGGAIMTTNSIRVVGNYSGVGFKPTPLTKQRAIADPLANLAAPSIGNCLYSTKLIVKNVQTLDPGVYCGGLQVSSGGIAKLNPGVYILKGGGLVVQSGGTLTGDKVNFYNTGPSYGPIDIGSGANITLTSPADGAYKGIVFFTDRTITDTKHPNSFTANSVSNLTGTIYFPSTPVKLSGGADVYSQRTLLIVKSMSMSGNIQFDVLTEQDSVSEYTTDAPLVY